MVILWQQQIRMEVDSSEVEKSDIDADTEVSWDMICLKLSIIFEQQI